MLQYKVKQNDCTWENLDLENNNNRKNLSVLITYLVER